MSDLRKTIGDLIFFYIKTNYEKYLKDNKLTKIDDNKIEKVIEELYDERVSHLKIFVKDSLKQLLKNEYPGDLIVVNIFTEIFNDDKICKNRLVYEIRMHQNKNTNISFELNK
jgi:hypothetical protein